MPIYAYRCDACGFRKDVLQKMSDPALITCPTCGAESFAKQLSAPAFQLKGTGWYATDFRDNGKKADGEAVKPVPPGETAPAANGSAANGDGDAGAERNGAGKSDGKADGAPANGGGAGGAAPVAGPVAKPAAKSAGATGAAGSPSTTGGTSAS